MLGLLRGVFRGEADDLRGQVWDDKRCDVPEGMQGASVAQRLERRSDHKRMQPSLACKGLVSAGVVELDHSCGSV